MNIYTGKTAVVTGSRGIGETITKSLFAQGANVIIVSASDSGAKLAASLHPAQIADKEHSKSDDPSIIDKTTTKIQDVLHIGSSSSRDAQKATGIRCDLSSAASAADLAKKVVEAAKTLPGNSHGKIDYLILCAGINPLGTLAEVDEHTWNNMFAVNVVGPVFLTKHLASSIANEGRILFFSSGVTMNSSVGSNFLAYAASKGTIEQTARALAKDQSLVSRGISVTTISPGPTDTTMFREGKSESLIHTIKNANPFARLGETDDIAKVVDGVLLAGKWLNGANIRATGGTFV
jgi:3-oxoacyl-[acyl-carrier protein] reductase